MSVRLLAEMTEEDKHDLTTWRILTIIFTVLAGFFFFIPFSRCCQKIKGQMELYPGPAQTHICKGRCIQFLNCFAGGALLALALCHILPETQKEYDKYLQVKNRKYIFFENFPFVYFLIIAGFIITLCLDQVFFKPAWKAIQLAQEAESRADIYLDKQENIEMEQKEDHKSSENNENRAQQFQNGFDQKLEEGSTPQRNNDMAEGGRFENKGNFMNVDATIQLDKTNLQYEGGDLDADNDAQIDTERQLQEDQEQESPTASKENEKQKMVKPPILPAPEIIAPQSLFFFSIIFILQSFVMGLTIGAFQNLKEYTAIAVLVIFQKIVVALSFGVTFVSGGRLCCDKSSFIFGILFTAATPVGIGIMWAGFEEEMRITDPLILCIHGIVCGSILYIACSDLIAREFQASEDMNPEDLSSESSKGRTQKCISCVKMFFVFMGAIFILFVFTAGGSDLMDPDSLVHEHVKVDVGHVTELAKKVGGKSDGN